MKIPFVDLKMQYLSIKDEIDAAIQGVIDETSFIMGDEVRAFESEFAQFCEAKFAVGVSSGTDALHMTLLACGVGRGDEVITVPNTFIATTEAISNCGAKPVFVDIDPQTYNMDVRKIEDKISSKTKAILPVHLFGQPADMNPILKIADKRGLKVIEDAAQAHGAIYNGKKVGTLGDAACFSFFPGKNLGAFGDGGAVVTNNENIAQQVKLLRNHGRDAKYEHLVEGFCNRLDSVQAAILSVKLKRLSDWNGKRRKAAKLYDELLGNKGIKTPCELKGVQSVYHLYVIRAKNRDDLKEKLRSEGISAGVHYPVPLHLQPAYKYLGYKKGDFREAEKAQREILSLPIYPEIQEGQIKRVVEVLTSSHV
jgi:dTDP-4-amino-4,6-dideoxygalactose transaminase